MVSTQSGQTYPASNVDTGNHCDDCTTPISLPFPVYVYGTPYTSAYVDSDGTLQFESPTSLFSNSCLPGVSHGRTMFPYWDDLFTSNAGYGIYTSTTGSAPNRVFHIEWRAQYYPGNGTANFEFSYNESDQVLKVDLRHAHERQHVVDGGRAGRPDEHLRPVRMQRRRWHARPGHRGHLHAGRRTTSARLRRLRHHLRRLHRHRLRAGRRSHHCRTTCSVPATASDGTYVYVFGGYSFTSVATLDTVYRYDPAANSWSTMAPMPTRALVASAVYYPPTNKIYVFGGVAAGRADRVGHDADLRHRIEHVVVGCGACRRRGARWRAASIR